MRQLQHFLTLTIVSCLLAGAATAQDLSPSGRNTDAATAAKIEAALGKKATLEFVESPLSEVVDFLSQLHGINIYLDARGLDDVGIGTDTPVTTAVKGISLRSALNITLRELALTYIVEDGGLKITTPEVAESSLITQVYPVVDLLERTPSGHYDYDALTEAIETMIDVSSWENVGGPATMNGILGNLVVSQTNQGHNEVRQYLASYRQLRKALAKSQGKLNFNFVSTNDSPAAAKIRAQLDSQVNANFIETPLSDVVDFFSELTNVPIILDRAALDDVGLGADTPITFKGKNQRLQDVLRRMLHAIDLTFTVQDETLQITTIETVETQLGVRLYPVGHLLHGDDDNQAETLDRLIGIITANVAPDTWDDLGGPSSLTVLAPNILSISQIDENHDEITKLLISIREQGVPANAKGKSMRRIVYPLMLNTESREAEDRVGELAAKLPAMLPKIKWDAEGADIQHFARSLVVTNTSRAHMEIRQLLVEMRLIAQPSRGHNPAPGGGMFRVQDKISK